MIDVYARLSEMEATPKMWATTNEAFAVQVLVLLECSDVETNALTEFIRSMQYLLSCTLEVVFVRSIVTMARVMLDRHHERSRSAHDSARVPTSDRVGSACA
jgi:hypothetical protein